MNFDHLSRVDLGKIGSTNTNSLGLFPMSKKSLQRVLVGDDTGKVQCLLVKKGNISSQFKHREKKGITGIEMFNERAFIGTGNAVKGINKKGKEFYSLTSNCTEEVQHISLRVPNLFMSGKYLMYHYNDAQEMGVYSCSDQIQAIAQGTIDGTVKPILGCKDRMVRIIDGERDHAEVYVKNSVTSVATYNTEKSKQAILYGTENGIVGTMKISGGQPKMGWTIDENRNSAQCTYAVDYTADGVEDLFIGRDNGDLELYTFDVSTAPTKAFSKSLNESVTGIRTGNVLSGVTNDIVATTYAGKILAFHDKNASASERAKPQTQTNKLFANIKSGVTGGEGKQLLGLSSAEEIEAVRKEIKGLKNRLTQVQYNYKKLSEDEIAVHCKYSFKHKFILDTESASYRLVVELDIPIDMIALHGMLPIEVIACETEGVVISKQVEPKGKHSSAPAAQHITFRCTQSVNRIEVNLRSTEGVYGDIELFVVPGLAPKISQMTTFTIRPLSLHVRVNDIPNMDSLPLNEMSLTGSFSMEEIHGWLSLCLEDIPDRIIKDEAEYFYKSTFQDTMLYIQCSRGNLVFKSDNASTISVLEGVITRQATLRKTRLTSNFKMNPQSYVRVVTLVYPKLEYQLKLSDRVALIDSLKELQLQEENLEYLDEEYREILKNEKQLRLEVTTSEQRLAFLKDILERLIVDCYKFKQQNSSPATKQFQEMFENKSFTLKQLIGLFSSS